MFPRVFAVVALVGLLTNASRSAEITWGPAFDIESDADIDLSGEIVRAVNVSTLGDPIDVQIGDVTVSFEPEHSFVDVGGSATGQGTFYSGQDQGLTTENVELDLVLDSHGWVSGAPDTIAELTLFDLTVGTSYQIQLIGAADDRSCCEMRRQRVHDDDGNPVSDYFGRQTDIDDDGIPGPGSVIGVFTADATEQLINIVGEIGPDGEGDGRDPGLSAYILSLAPSVGIPGDVNGDGVVDAADIDGVAAAVRNAVTDAKFDLNEDGQVTLADHTHLVKTILNTWIGDANLDKEFNTRDFVQVFQIGEFEDATAGNSGWSEGDWNGDGDFGTGDFVLAFQDGGFERGPRAADSAVPEPSAIALALMALLGLVRRKRAGR